MQQLECGDVVVHPQHGPAAVRRFAERVVGDRTIQYVVMETLGNGMRIKAPVDGLDAIGVRMPKSVAELDRVLDVLRAEGEELEVRWTDRMKTVEGQLASGRLEDAAEVARDFTRRERGHGISYAERQQKTKAMRRVGLEFAAVHGQTFEDAERLVEAAIFENVEIEAVA